MISPAAMMIEAAQDQLANKDYREANEWILASQLKEVHFAIVDKPEDFYEGYMLGIQTARVLLAGMMAAVKNHIEI